VKLAASMVCVAALSFAACTDEETTVGGQGAGITSWKIADQRFEQLVKQFDPSQVTDKAMLGGHMPADEVCDGCVMQAYKVVESRAAVDEIRVVSDGGVPVCKILLNQGAIVFDECGLSRL